MNVIDKFFKKSSLNKILFWELAISYAYKKYDSIRVLIKVTFRTNLIFRIFKAI